MTYFRVLPVGTRPTRLAANHAYLLMDNWDDWFKYSTLYYLVIFDEVGERHNIGGVKIGQFAMEEGQRRANLPEGFDELDERFFSLGQDDSYYDDLNRLGAATRDRVLRALHDVAFDIELFERALNEKVTGTSLLRSVDRSTVTGQFRRMALGGVRLTSYEFSYTARRRSKRIEPLRLTFTVAPESYPPTNVHVLIGRNGVGKTTLLNEMTRAIVEEDADADEVGAFSAEMSDFDDRLFTSLVSVTFSAFDPFEPLPSHQDKSEGVRYAYIGLKHIGKDKYGKVKPPKSPDALSGDFVSSVLICRQGAKVARWQRALEMLQTDPIFRDAEVSSLAKPDVELDEVKADARRLFKKSEFGPQDCSSDDHQIGRNRRGKDSCRSRRTRGPSSPAAPLSLRPITFGLAHQPERRRLNRDTLSRGASGGPDQLRLDGKAHGNTRRSGLAGDPNVRRERWCPHARGLWAGGYAVWLPQNASGRCRRTPKLQ
jgi:energy-coupling factor transporter ATP-binding protein EcfA2